MTLALHEHATELGVRPLSPDPRPGTRGRRYQPMRLLASGALRLRRQRQLPMADAAEAHRLLENGEAHEKLVLESP